MEAERQDDQLFEVWEANWPALGLFLDISTQWRVAYTRSGLRYIGLDYVAVDVVMRRSSIDDADGQLFADLQSMEEGALVAFSEVGLA